MTRYVEIDDVCCTVYSCYDCPLYDGVDGGYNDQCHHPLMPRDMEGKSAWEAKAYDRGNGMCTACPLRYDFGVEQEMME